MTVPADTDDLAALLGPAADGVDDLEWATIGRGARVVPLATRRTAAAAVASRDGSGGRRELPRALLAAGLRVGVVQPLLRSRLRVAREGSLVAALEEALGRCNLAVGVAVGRPRANLKPVLQVLERDGRTIAWAKVGWNDLTRSLVANEARVLADVAGRFDVVTPPPLLARFSHAGAEVVVTGALPPGPSPAPPRPFLTGAVLRDTCRVAPQDDHASARVEWWRRVESSVTGPAAAALEPAARVLDDVELRFGGWHGDLSPWNGWWSGPRLHLLDWERAGGPVPYGIDALHGEFVLSLLERGRPVEAAILDAESAAAGVLADAGVDTPARAISVAYLVELLARVVDDEASSPVALLGATDVARAIGIVAVRA